MKSATLALVSLLFAAPLSCYAVERLVPAGSLIECTISEPKLSSKTTSVGDPVLCQVGYSGYGSRFGRAVVPYDSYLGGRFEDYKDPGHLVGKGWMELEFDHMVIEPDTVIPLNARVVGVTGYNVDREGRILGKGHAVRDTVEWMLPILWPIDMLNLLRRGPRPTLKVETRLTLKVMGDLRVPATNPPRQEPSGLMERNPTSYMSPPSDAVPPGRVAPIYYPPMIAPPPPDYWFAASPSPPLATARETPPAVFVQRRRPPYRGRDSQYPVTLVFKDGRQPEYAYNYVLTPSALYVMDGYRRVIPVSELDLAATSEVNRDAGVSFLLPGDPVREPPRDQPVN